MAAHRAGGAYLATLWTWEGRPLLAGVGAGLFCRVLARQKTRLGYRLRAFVVLPDRACLILTTPDGEERSAGVVVQRLRARAARELGARRLRIGRIFDDATPIAELRDAGAVARRAAFLHRLPVLMGIARRPEDWPWSSERAWAGTGRAPAPVELPEAPPGEDRVRVEGLSG